MKILTVKKSFFLIFPILYGCTQNINSANFDKYKKTNMNENMTYPIIKSGVINFARQMCSYYGKYNIRVNTVCPGGLEGHAAGFSEKQNPTFLRNYLKRIPLKKMCDFFKNLSDSNFFVFQYFLTKFSL